MPGLRYCLFFVEDEPVIWEHAGRFEKIYEWPWIKPENWRIARSWLGGVCGAKPQLKPRNDLLLKLCGSLKRGFEKSEKLGTTALDGPSLGALGEMGIKTFDAQSLLFEARKVKTEDEVNCLKMIAAITDRAWCKLYEAMKPGMRDIDLTALGYQAMIEAGAEIGGVVPFFSGPSTFERGLAMTDRIIQPGDMVYGDITNFGYLGTRPASIGRLLQGENRTKRKKTSTENYWTSRMRSSKRLSRALDWQTPHRSSSPQAPGATMTRIACSRLRSDMESACFSTNCQPSTGYGLQNTLKHSK